MLKCDSSIKTYPSPPQAPTDLFVFLTLYLQCRSGGSLKHLPHALLALGRALEVGKGVDLLGHGPAFLWLDRLLLHLVELFDRV